MSYQKLTIVLVFATTCLTVDGMFDDFVPFFLGNGVLPVSPPGYHYETRGQISRYPRNSYKIMPYGVALATGQLSRNGNRNAGNKLTTRSVAKRPAGRSRSGGGGGGGGRRRRHGGGGGGGGGTNNDDVNPPTFNDTETIPGKPPTSAEDEKRRKRSFLALNVPRRTNSSDGSENVNIWMNGAADGDERASMLAGRTDHVVAMETDGAETADRGLLRLNRGTVAAPYLPIANKSVKFIIVPDFASYPILLLALNAAARTTSEAGRNYLKTNKGSTDAMTFRTSTVSSSKSVSGYIYVNRFNNKWNNDDQYQYNHYQYVQNILKRVDNSNFSLETSRVFDKITVGDVNEEENGISDDDADDFNKYETIEDKNVDFKDNDDKNSNGDDDDVNGKYKHS